MRKKGSSQKRSIQVIVCMSCILCIFEYAITPSVGWDVIPGRVIAENHTWDKYKIVPHRQAKNPNVI